MLELTIGVVAALAVAAIIIRLDKEDPFTEADAWSKTQDRLRKVQGGAK